MPSAHAASMSSSASECESPWPKNEGAEPTPPKLPQPRATRGTRWPAAPSGLEGIWRPRAIGAVFDQVRQRTASRTVSPPTTSSPITAYTDIAPVSPGCPRSRPRRSADSHSVVGGPGRPRSADHGLLGLDGLQLVDLRAPVLPMGRDAHVRAQLRRGLVDEESLRRPVGELHQQAAGAAAVHGEEVAAVLGLRDIGEAQADDVVLDHLLVLGGADVKGLVVDGALAEVPGALMQVGLLHQLQDAAEAVGLADPVLVVLAFVAERLAVHALDDEVVHRALLGHRGRRAKGAADGVLGGHMQVVGLARVGVGIGHQRVLDPAWVAEEEALGAAALDALVLDAVLLEAIGPVADGVHGDREQEGLGLVGAALAHPARLAVGEGGQQRARVARAVAVVEVIDRDLAVEQDRLLDAPQTQQAQ